MLLISVSYVVFTMVPGVTNMALPLAYEIQP